jgi:hypothetical protein
VKGGDLTVYFDREADLEKASSIAEYWKDHDLLTGKKQDLKLTFQDSTYFLYLIKRGDLDLGNTDLQEQMLLLELQKDLLEAIFKECDLELVITDDHFEPLTNINN